MPSPARRRPGGTRAACARRRVSTRSRADAPCASSAAHARPERCDEPITISAAASRSARARRPAAGESSETSCIRRSGTDGRCSRPERRPQQVGQRQRLGRALRAVDADDDRPAVGSAVDHMRIHEACGIPWSAAQRSELGRPRAVRRRPGTAIAPLRRRRPTPATRIAAVRGRETRASRRRRLRAGRAPTALR